MDRIPLGETKAEAISRVQERLGPATSRPLAEQTFWSLARSKQITRDDNGVYLIEASVDDDSMRQTAKQHLQMSQKPRGGMKHFKISHHNMVKARVSTHWKAALNSMKNAFAPDLSSSEGYKPPEDDE